MIWPFKKPKGKVLHERFPEVLRWQVNDVVYCSGDVVYCSGLQRVFQGVTEDSIIVYNQPYNKLEKWHPSHVRNESFSQRALVEELNGEYNKFVQFCSEEYIKLITK